MPYDFDHAPQCIANVRCDAVDGHAGSCCGAASTESSLRTRESISGSSEANYAHSIMPARSTSHADARRRCATRPEAQPKSCLAPVSWLILGQMASRCLPTRSWLKASALQPLRAPLMSSTESNMPTLMRRCNLPSPPTARGCRRRRERASQRRRRPRQLCADVPGRAAHLLRQRSLFGQLIHASRHWLRLVLEE